VKNFKILGQEDAPVFITEFTDLQCPYCGQFARETFPKLRATYIDTGRVRFGSIDVPLEMHPYAVPAAVAARCAGEQGRYWEYRERVFQNQDELGNSPYSSFAAQLGLDLQRFEACRIDGRELQAVQQDKAHATVAGINSTPTFVIGKVVNGQFQGETVYGVQPFEVFAQKIDALLASH
jgi:protein-disulfide isomerase